MVLAAFAEKRPLPPKEEAHWRVLSVVGFCRRLRGLRRDGAVRGPLLANLLRASLIGGEAAQDYVDGGLRPCSHSDQVVHEAQ